MRFEQSSKYIKKLVVMKTVINYHLCPQRTKSNVTKLQPGRFQIDIRKNFLTM